MAEKDVTELAKAVSAGVAEALEKNNPKKVSIGRFDPRTPFHPDKNKAARFAAGRKYFQNGVPIKHETTFDEEVQLLNRIRVSGTYMENTVQVIVQQRGDEEHINITYDNKTID